LPAALIFYHLFYFNNTAQKVVLLFLNIAFYAMGADFHHVILMLCLIAFDYISGILLGYFVEKGKVRHSRFLLTFIIVLHIASLIPFKYLNFLLELYNNIFENHLTMPFNLVVPLGISFYTLRAISYHIDVFRKETKYQRNPIDLAIYISFFPQLLTGPLICYTEFQRNLKERYVDKEIFYQGIKRFSIGLIKVVLIARNLSHITDSIFMLTTYGNTSNPVPVLVTWLGAITCTLQFYYDFTGFSDMSIGIGKLLGFSCEENFDHPMLAMTATSFCHKFNISLRLWFEKYVFGKSPENHSRNEDTQAKQIAITWLLIGLWFGTGWNYIWWSAIIIVILIIEIIFQLQDTTENPLFRHLYVLLISVFFIIFLRFDSASQMTVFLSYMFGLSNNGLYSSRLIMYLSEYKLTLTASILCIFMYSKPIRKYMNQSVSDRAREYLNHINDFILIALFFFSFVALTRGYYEPYIFMNL
jgi:alginate O-acetyltransferase complex protein AlgI